MPRRPPVRPPEPASVAPKSKTPEPTPAPLSIEAKIVVLGAQGVGKTSLVHRFVKGTPPPSDNSVPSTIGASFLTKKLVDADTGTSVRLQLWDTAGQERFRSLGKLYYRGANAALLCYDITRSDSLRDVDTWLREIRANLPEDTIVHVVGTKADVVAEDPAKRTVGFESVVAYAAENLYRPGQGHTTGSSLTGTPMIGTPSIPAERKDDTVAIHRLSWLGGGSSSQAVSESQQQTPLTEPTPNSLFPPGQISAQTPRTSSFWGTDLGWDCCHEVSASSGEGVEELFRVVTQRLVEQRNARADYSFPSAAPSASGSGYQDDGERGISTGKKGKGGKPGQDQSDGYYGGEWHDGHGSFRVGVGDRRRSWLGLPVGEDETGEVGRVRRGGCC